jgi:hypothetical protein
MSAETPKQDSAPAPDSHKFPPERGPYRHVDTIAWLMPILIVVILGVGSLLAVLDASYADFDMPGGLHPILQSTLPLVGALCGFTLAFYFTNSRLEVMRVRESVAEKRRQASAGAILRPVQGDSAVVRMRDGPMTMTESLRERFEATGAARLILLGSDGTFKRPLSRSDLDAAGELDTPQPWPGGFVSPRTSLEGVADVLLSTLTDREVLVTEDGESTGRVLGRISDRMLLRHMLDR